MIISQIKYNGEKCYLEVDGKPFLYNAVQSWYPPEEDYEIYMKKAAEVDYKCFSCWIRWKSIEPQKSIFNWSEVIRVIDLANKYDMRLDFVWGGTNFCGHMDPRFTPVWVINEDRFHSKVNYDNRKNDDYDYPIYTDGGDAGMCFVANYKSQELLELEQHVMSELLTFLEYYDTNHRVIFIQVENEINMTKWVGGKGNILDYINNIAKVIKKHPYQIATRANIFAYRFENYEMDYECNDLCYVDGHGLDTYRSEVAITRKVINSIYNTKFKYIAENEAFENTTSHIVTALANGGFYNVYKVDYDYIHKKNGIFAPDFSYTAMTFRIKNLNLALNNLDEIITLAPRCDCLEFNTADDIPRKNTKQIKNIGKCEIVFECDNGSVGLAVLHNDCIYFIADESCIISVNGYSKEYSIGSVLTFNIE